ncbi:hypothetical protein ENHYDAX1_220292 [Enhydrobacter sp. AX1]|nr:hypothetical protein ENHYDAX1_220292 [Enhydrobacter sp. AX1]
MANQQRTLVIKVLSFLNHLCDGEHKQGQAIDHEFFLNHLCDGELAITTAGFNLDFLNHLCDGER